MPGLSSNFESASNHPRTADSLSLWTVPRLNKTNAEKSVQPSTTLHSIFTDTASLDLNRWLRREETETPANMDQKLETQIQDPVMDEQMELSDIVSFLLYTAFVLVYKDNL